MINLSLPDLAVTVYCGTAHHRIQLASVSILLMNVNKAHG